MTSPREAGFPQEAVRCSVSWVGDGEAVASCLEEDAQMSLCLDGSLKSWRLVSMKDFDIMMSIGKKELCWHE